MKKITSDVALIYSDGASIPNPGPGGWAFIVIVDGELIQERYDYAGYTTNNRMELLAVINGLKWVIQNVSVKRVTVMSDSMYVVCGSNSWAEKWEKTNFLGRANADLWKEILSLKNKIPMFCKHVRAHKGNAINEYCDFLANRAATEKIGNYKDLT